MFTRLRKIILIVFPSIISIVGGVDDDHPPLPKKPFIMVRHGESQWTPDMITQGPQDLPLTRTGRHQAEQSASVLKNFCETRDVSLASIIYTSSLVRTQETTQIINEQLGYAISVRPKLQERYFGDVRLLSESERQLKKTPPDAEPKDKFYTRIITCLSEILSEHPQGSIIVAHSGVFDCLVETLCPTADNPKINFAEAYFFWPADDRWFFKAIR